ncbi:hypothetical protein E3Q19_01333 [Wallemia mellicola]|nr:hypothetical protein E3Q19_01333 [Wallemia mellicola]
MTSIQDIAKVLNHNDRAGVRPEYDYRNIPEVLIGDPDDDLWVKYGHSEGGVPAVAIEKEWHYKGYEGNWNWSDSVFEFTSNTMGDSDWDSIDDALGSWGYFRTD